MFRFSSHRQPADASRLRQSLPRGLVRNASFMIMLYLIATPDAFAQRPFEVHDPFYRGETAQRAFFDGAAVRAELAYRPVGALPGLSLPGERGAAQNSLPDALKSGAALSGTVPPEPAMASHNALALMFQFDYAVTPHLDLTAIVDAAGGASGRQVAVSWIALKHYMHVDGVDYAFRLAVDPFTEPGVGFRRTDLAMITTTTLSPMLSTDFAVGWRRVRVSHDFWIPSELASQPGVPARLLQRAFGQEVHIMMNYRLIFDPAESNVFLSLVGEAGKYDLLEASIGSSSGAGRGRMAQDYKGAMIWLRTGFQWNRPSYQLEPFADVPMARWGSEQQDAPEPEARLHFGLRLTLR